MEWMSAIDSSFLHVENDTTPMHIGGVSIFEGPPPPFGELREMGADTTAAPQSRSWSAPPEPSGIEVLFRTIARRASPAGQLETLRGALIAPRESLRSLAEIARAAAAAWPSMRPVAASSLTGPIGPHRRRSRARARLSHLEAVRGTLGGTPDDGA